MAGATLPCVCRRRVGKLVIIVCKIFLPWQGGQAADVNLDWGVTSWFFSAVGIVLIPLTFVVPTP